MKCIICQEDEIHKQQVHEDIPLGDDIVKIFLEIMVYRNCGERYYDRRTVRNLEDTEKKLKAGEIPLLQVGRVLVIDEV